MPSRQSGPAKRPIPPQERPVRICLRTRPERRTRRLRRRTTGGRWGPGGGRCRGRSASGTGR
jgi:hypothetical protein